MSNNPNINLTTIWNSPLCSTQAKIGRAINDLAATSEDDGFTMLIAAKFMAAKLQAELIINSDKNPENVDLLPITHHFNKIFKHVEDPETKLKLRIIATKFVDQSNLPNTDIAIANLHFIKINCLDDMSTQHRKSRNSEEYESAKEELADLMKQGIHPSINEYGDHVEGSQYDLEQGLT